MCGIAGLMTFDGASPPPAPLRAMEAALRHRGPDGDGRYRSGDVGMVQTRLAIIDLATGAQPLHEPGGAALIANAEIYNYVELRERLRRDARPVAFATQSDCELPLHLYRRHGLDFTAHLRGMYALALHDPGARRLVLARDPFGIKPLYYAETAHGFAFASEPN
ncbi:MAG: asparagine synthetase B, partial [Stellaceae bacterium]